MTEKIQQLNVEDRVKQDLEYRLNAVLGRRHLLNYLMHKIDNQAPRLDPEQKNPAFQNVINMCRLLLNLCHRDGNAGFAPYALAAVDHLAAQYEATLALDSQQSFLADQTILNEVIRLFNIDADLAKTFEG